tara:strand:- start:749 stop:976 length:228 start_codon:yes stop_codon:yes gene_type:complete
MKTTAGQQLLKRVKSLLEKLAQAPRQTRFPAGIIHSLETAHKALLTELESPCHCLPIRTKPKRLTGQAPAIQGTL